MSTYYIVLYATRNDDFNCSTKRIHLINKRHPPLMLFIMTTRKKYNFDLTVTIYSNFPFLSIILTRPHLYPRGSWKSSLLSCTLFQGPSSSTAVVRRCNEQKGITPWRGLHERSVGHDIFSLILEGLRRITHAYVTFQSLSRFSFDIKLWLQGITWILNIIESATDTTGRRRTGWGWVNLNFDRFLSVANELFTLGLNTKLVLFQCFRAR